MISTTCLCIMIHVEFRKLRNRYIKQKIFSKLNTDLRLVSCYTNTCFLQQELFFFFRL